MDEWNTDELNNWGVDIPDEWKNVNEDNDNLSDSRGSLSDRFIIPPFSILDTRGGAWLERKKNWLRLGIRSEIGRDGNITYAVSSQPPAVYEARNKIKAKTGTDPSWDELIKYCMEHNIKIQSGTSIFDPVLCELSYRWFNVPNGIIIDPFAGGSVRGIVASKLGMQYNGCDLRKEQIDANIENAHVVLSDSNPIPNWKCANSLNIDDVFKDIQADMIFSCPPYADLERYSNNPEDLSTMNYEDFKKAYFEIIRKCCGMLRENRFAVFVVGEVRGKDGMYYNFVGDTIKAFEDAGLHYYNEMILVNVISSLAIRVTKQFNNSRKIGKHHQNVLVFYKGNDAKSIKRDYPGLDIKENEIQEFVNNKEKENEIQQGYN